MIVKRATEAMTETVIGTAILFNFEVLSGLAEIGYLLGREHWGKGYAFEAMTAFIELSHSTLDLRRLEATVDVRNAASNALLQPLGFTIEGVLRERWLAAEELQDINLHALLKREWRTNSPDRPTPLLRTDRALIVTESSTPTVKPHRHARGQKLEANACIQPLRIGIV